MKRRTILKGGIVLAATARTAIADERRDLIGDRIERHSVELSEALEEWQVGSFMGMIYPSRDPRSISLRQIGRSPVLRFRQAAEGMQQAHSLIDPSVTHWQKCETIADDLLCCIMLTG